MSYNEQLQRIVKKYESAENPFPATALDIAQWAIEQRLWEPQRSMSSLFLIWPLSRV